MNIYEEIAIHKSMDRRSQILNSLKDTRKALEAEIDETTRVYLQSYRDELERELKQLGLN
jgi:hypothetical protein